MNFVAATHKNITQDSIKYYELQDDGYHALNRAPTNAGDYMAELKLPSVKTPIKVDGSIARYVTGTVTATVEYTIAKKPVNLSVRAESRAAIVYGQPLSAYKNIDRLINNEDNVPGKFEWAEPNTVPPSIIRKDEYTVIFTPDDTNYETTTCKVGVRVNPAPQTEISPPKGKTPLTYTGENLELVEPGSAKHGYMMYAVGEAAPNEDSDWSRDVPTGKAAGTYQVWYKVLGYENYDNLVRDEYHLSVTIAKAASSGKVTATETVMVPAEAKAAVAGRDAAEAEA
jgi:hypothetical protein